MRNLLRNTYYLRMSAEQFSFLHVESGRLVSQPPLLAWRSVGHKRQPLAAGDAALAMAMGHVILNEFHLQRQSSYFVEYMRQYTDMPMLVLLEPRHSGDYAAGRLLRAADLVH